MYVLANRSMSALYIIHLRKVNTYPNTEKQIYATNKEGSFFKHILPRAYMLNYMCVNVSSNPFLYKHDAKYGIQII